MKYYNALCVSRRSKVSREHWTTPEDCEVFDICRNSYGGSLTSDPQTHSAVLYSRIIFSFLFFIFCFQLCDTQTTSVNAPRTALLCFLMRVSGESHRLLSCLESLAAPSHTALYCLLCNAHAPPEGNSSPSDKGNLINNHSHFYFALSLIWTSLHTVSVLRRASQNFIKGEMSSGILQQLRHNMWNSNKTKYDSQCTSYSVCRKLKWSCPQL